jgi:hypothetical protein
VCPATAATVRLKGTLHGLSPYRERTTRTCDRSQAGLDMSNCPAPGDGWPGSLDVRSRKWPGGCGGRRGAVSPRSFPHLWKKLWKRQGFSGTLCLHSSVSRGFPPGVAAESLILPSFSRRFPATAPLRGAVRRRETRCASDCHDRHQRLGAGAGAD